MIGKHENEQNINIKKLVYISHPSSGLEENTKDIEKIIQKLYLNDEIFNEYCFVSPVHNYGFMYHDTEYNRGLSYCTDLLYFCDEMWVFGDWKESRGCRAEVELANKLGIKTRFLGSSNNLDNVITNKSYKVDFYVDTPSQRREIKRNKSLFMYVKSKKVLEGDSSKLRNYIKNKVLYTSRESAFKSISKKHNSENYTLIEVEIDGNSILDLDDAQTVDAIHSYIKANRENLSFKAESSSVVEEYALKTGKKAIKRIIRSYKKLLMFYDVTVGNREAVKVLDNSCIKGIKIYNTYVLNDNKQLRTFTFVKSI